MTKRFQVKVNDTDVIHVLSFDSVNNLTSRGGKFTLKCLDLLGTFYDSISAGDEIKLYDNNNSLNSFGGYLENIKREVKNGKLVEITGNDYTAKLHNLMIYSQVYRQRELSVMVRDLAFKDLIPAINIDACDATTGWIDPVQWTLTLDAANDANGNPYARLGTGCLKLVTDGTLGAGSVYKIFSSININTTDSVGFYFWIEDSSEIDYIDLYFGTNHANSYAVRKNNLSNGWNYLIYAISDYYLKMGTPDLTDVSWFEINVYFVGTPTTTFRLDDIKLFQTVDGVFSLDNVQITEVYLEDALFRNLTLFQCYQRLCSVREELYDFYIDINKCINFGEFGTVASGETIERGTNLISAKFDDNPKKLFNDVVLYGGRQHYTFNETFNGDGANDTFTIQYEPVNVEVSVGSVIQKGYKPDSGETFDYKVDLEAKEVIFEAGSIPAGGTNNVDITYTYSVPTVVRKKNNESIVKYGLRQTKLENPLITTVTDGKDVVSSFLEKNADPLEVGKLITTMNTDIDVGETIQFIDSNLFSSTQTLTVIEVANYFIGKKPHTELTVTEDSETVEDFLVEIFRRLNAVEEVDKGISEITTQFEDYSEDEAIADSAANLVVKSRASAGFILGHPTLGLIGNNIGSNTNAYGGDITSGKSG